MNILYENDNNLFNPYSFLTLNPSKTSSSLNIEGATDFLNFLKFLGRATVAQCRYKHKGPGLWASAWRGAAGPRLGARGRAGGHGLGPARAGAALRGHTTGRRTTVQIHHRIFFSRFIFFCEDFSCQDFEDEVDLYCFPPPRHTTHTKEFHTKEFSTGSSHNHLYS